MYISIYIHIITPEYVQRNVKTCKLMEVDVNKCKNICVYKSNVKNANMQTNVNTYL